MTQKVLTHSELLTKAVREPELLEHDEILRLDNDLDMVIEILDFQLAEIASRIQIQTSGASFSKKNIEREHHRELLRIALGDPNHELGNCSDFTE
jgi:hypothetical protein